MVQKKMRATSLNGNEGHVFKLSAAVVLGVNRRSLSAVAIRCSVAQSDDGVGVVEAVQRRFASCDAEALKKKSPYSTLHSA